MQHRKADNKGALVQNAGAAWLNVALALFFLSCMISSVSATQQEEGRAPREDVDPYTEGQAEAMAKLGIRRFGPFQFGDGRTTEVSAREVGDVPFLWVETAHFQLGCSLEPMGMPTDSKAKKQLQAELKDLAKRLPNLPRRVKKLDPWLILHLYAARLEANYSEFVTRLGLEEVAAKDPYLGSGGPICVLITEKRSTLARYTSLACGRSADNSLRHYFDQPKGQVFFGIAFESLEGDLHDDRGLHFALVHSVTRVMAEAVRGYHGILPTWFSMGLGHWFAREFVGDDILLYTTPRGESGRQKEDSKFAVKVRARVDNGIFPSFEEMEAWDDPTSLRFADHMMAWSHLDFMLRADDGQMAHAFLWAASEPVAWGVPKREEQLAALWHAALEDIAGGELAALDKAWADWVLDQYPRR